MRKLILGSLLVLGLAGCGDDDMSGVTDAATDAPSDVAADPCAACTTDEICVQRFDGTCGIRFHECVERTVACPDNVCSEDCEDAYCGADTYQCMNRPPCGTESPGAFTCYGV